MRGWDGGHRGGCGFGRLLVRVVSFFVILDFLRLLFSIFTSIERLWAIFL